MMTGGQTDGRTRRWSMLRIHIITNTPEKGAEVIQIFEDFYDFFFFNLHNFLILHLPTFSNFSSHHDFSIAKTLFYLTAKQPSIFIQRIIKKNFLRWKAIQFCLLYRLLKRKVELHSFCSLSHRKIGWHSYHGNDRENVLKLI